ncbi:MAG TPA: phosphatase PAP2 family protein [Ferruginibacter sp.]|nr:phosphatase PAP2 family protein [Ferruginibacter sp.]
MFPPFKNHPVWYISIDLLFHMILFISVLAAVVFTLKKHLREHKEIDLLVFKRLLLLQTPVFDKFMLMITSLGNHQVLIPSNLFLILGFVISKDQHNYILAVLLVSLSSLLLMFILKRVFRRKRPLTPLLFQARGLSFPSGHAMMSVAFYGLLLHMLFNAGINPNLYIPLSIVIILLILAIGFSRVYLQVHYVSDVLAGFVVGGSWLYVCLHVLKKLPELLAEL